jgi:Na+/H+-dicarboxylate symporter/ABC-type amino acid transport substrate-binding protein
MFNGTIKARPVMPMLIVLGAGLGIFTGLFLGEYASVLHFIGDAYVQLLLMCVYPYLIASILHGLGKMDPVIAKRVFRKSWYFYVLAWALILATMMLLGVMFPAPGAPKVLVPAGQTSHFDVVKLLIPGNLFQSLSGNYVPAVVVFAVFFGLAIQHVKNRNAFLEITEQIKTASVRIWNWIVFVAPVGVFALFADVAGTIQSQDVKGILVYIVIVFLSSAVLIFLVLPYLISSFTGLSNRHLIKEIQGALLLAIMTSLSVVALPAINDLIIKLSRDKGVDDPDLPEITGTQVSIAYPFAQLGNLFVIFFILFSGYFFHLPLSLPERMMLPFTTLLSTFGSPSSAVNAVNFMTSIFHLPAGVVDLFVTSNSLTRYAMVAVSVMGFAFVAVLSTLSFYGKLTFRPFRLLRPFLVWGIFLLAVIFGSRSLLPSFWKTHTIPYGQFRLEPELASRVHAKVFNVPDTLPHVEKRTETTLQYIHKLGILRVGYGDGYMPFCYRNQWGELVGYDVSFMYQLAADINVDLEFYPYDINRMSRDLEEQRFDIAIGGLTVTVERLQKGNFSNPYIQSPYAILARSDLVSRLVSGPEVLKQTNLVIARYDNAVLHEFIRTNFPKNPVVDIASYQDIPDHPEIDIAFWSLAKAQAYAYTHDGFTAVVPVNFAPPFLYGYYMASGAIQFTNYVNYWIDLQRNNGFADRQKDLWINGNVPAYATNRWCIIRDVLHWVK